MISDPGVGGLPRVAEETWFGRDLPVLVAVVTLFDRPNFGFLTYEQVADEVGLRGDVVSRALQALKSGGYIDTRPAGAGDASQHWVTGISASARVVAGQWPSESAVVERLLTALEEQSRSATEEQKGKLRRLRQAMIDAGTDVVARIIGEVVGTHLPRA